MAYTIELDISHETPIEMVQQFAKDHGCSAELLMKNGPAGGNPLYKFSSDNFDYLQELTEQLFGPNYFDQEDIIEMIVEV